MKNRSATSTLCGLLSAILALTLACSGYAQGKSKVHPRNIQLIKAGILKGVPKYYPDIPRITAQEALALYQAQKSLFLLISYHNKDQIVGGLHLTEGQYPKLNPNRLPLKKGQALVVY